jgi:hypothetical protein
MIRESPLVDRGHFLCNEVEPDTVQRWKRCRSVSGVGQMSGAKCRQQVVRITFHERRMWPAPQVGWTFGSAGHHRELSCTRVVRAKRRITKRLRTSLITEQRKLFCSKHIPVFGCELVVTHHVRRSPVREEQRYPVLRSRDRTMLTDERRQQRFHGAAHQSCGAAGGGNDVSDALTRSPNHPAAIASSRDATHACCANDSRQVESTESTAPSVT